MRVNFYQMNNDWLKLHSLRNCPNMAKWCIGLQNKSVGLRVVTVIVYLWKSWKGVLKGVSMIPIYFNSSTLTSCMFCILWHWPEMRVHRGKVILLKYDFQLFSFPNLSMSDISSFPNRFSGKESDKSWLNWTLQPGKSTFSSAGGCNEAADILSLPPIVVLRIWGD